MAQRGSSATAERTAAAASDGAREDVLARAAHARGDHETMLRHLVRAEVATPSQQRRDLIARLSGGRSLEELAALHAADLLPPRLSTPTRVRSDGGRWGTWLDGLMAAAVPMIHVVEAAWLLPVKAIFGLVGEAVGATRIDVAAPVLVDMAWNNPVGRLAMISLGVLSAGCLLRTVQLHVLRVHTEKDEIALLSAPRSWWSYDLRLAFPVLCMGLATVLLAHGYGWASSLLDAAAAIAIIGTLWLAIPGGRPRLLIAEVPGHPQQTRIEVMQGVLVLWHEVQPIIDLRSAVMVSRQWWNPFTSSIELQKTDGSRVELPCVSTPRRTHAVVIRLNELIRATRRFPAPPAPGAPR